MDYSHISTASTLRGVFDRLLFLTADETRRLLDGDINKMYVEPEVWIATGIIQSLPRHATDHTGLAHMGDIRRSRVISYQLYSLRVASYQLPIASYFQLPEENKGNSLVKFLVTREQNSGADNMLSHEYAVDSRISYLSLIVGAFTCSRLRTRLMIPTEVVGHQEKPRAPLAGATSRCHNQSETLLMSGAKPPNVSPWHVDRITCVRGKPSGWDASVALMGRASFARLPLLHRILPNFSVNPCVLQYRQGITASAAPLYS